MAGGGLQAGRRGGTAIAAAARPRSSTITLREIAHGVIEAGGATGGAGRVAALGAAAAHRVGDVGRRVAGRFGARRDIEAVGLGGGDRAGATRDDQLALAAVRRRHLHAALLNRDRGAAAVDGDAEHRPLHEGDQIRGTDAEVRCLLLLDAKDGPPIILEDLDDAARIARLGQAQPRRRRDDHIILAAHEHGARARRRLDHVACAQHRPAPHRRHAVAVPDVDLARSLRHPPRGLARDGGGAGEEGDKDEEAAGHGHGDDQSSARAGSGARPIMPDAALTKAQGGGLMRR